MFERYTEKARRVIFFSRYEASQYGSPYIETEHLLLGLMREDRTLFAGTGDTSAFQKELESQIPHHGEKTSTSVDLPMSAEAKRVLEYATEEADGLSHPHIDTGHLLLGLLRLGDCVAAVFLRKHDFDYETYREAMRSLPPETA